MVFHGYGGQTMSEAGKAAMSAGDGFVCPITVWEISRKIVLGKLERPAPPGFNFSLSAWLRHAGYPQDQAKRGLDHWRTGSRATGSAVVACTMTGPWVIEEQYRKYS